jgi:hypothetical protein
MHVQGRHVNGTVAETSDRKRAPFHVTALRTTQGENAILCKDVERQRVNSLLVKDNEALPPLFGVDSLIADQVLELHNFLHPLVCKFSFRLDKFLTLFCRRIEES